MQLGVKENTQQTLDIFHCGQESLTIIIRYALILVSAHDPGSAVFHSGKGMNNMLPPPARARKQSGLLSKAQNLPFAWKVLCFTRAGPRGLEPRPTVLETVILPLNYRPLDSLGDCLS